MQALNPDAQLTTGDLLLREAERGIRHLAWRQTKDATKRNPQHVPKPIPLTAAEVAADKAERARTQMERPDGMSLAEANEFLGW